VKKLHSYIKMGLAAGVMVAAVSPALAAGKSASPVPDTAKKASALAPSAGQTVLRATKTAFGNGLEAVGPGFVAIDAGKTLLCPNDGGSCRIEADQNVQVTDGPGGNNRWAICTQVDGSFMAQPLCPFLGVINPDIFQAGSFIQTQSGIGPGTHTVRSFIFTDAGATRSIYTIVYRLYH